MSSDGVRRDSCSAERSTQQQAEQDWEAGKLLSEKSYPAEGRAGRDGAPRLGIGLGILGEPGWVCGEDGLASHIVLLHVCTQESCYALLGRLNPGQPHPTWPTRICT